MASAFEAPKEILARGANVLAPLMERHGFSFEITQYAKGSGGHFAVGEFRKGSQRLKLFYRFSLAGVFYSAGGCEVPHQEYMAALGVNDTSYPGYTDDALDGFHRLLSDLQSFASDFLSGETSILESESRRVLERKPRETRAQAVRAVGDLRARQQAREYFRNGDHKEVCRLRAQLQYPEDLSAAENRMFDISAKRVRGT